MKYQSEYDEVLDALQEIGNPRLGLHIPIDRKSSLEYCGVRVPARRKRVKQGFSFTDLPDDDVLAIWSEIWHSSPNGDVMHCAIDWYRDRVRKDPREEWWPRLKTWISRIENWCHSDDLSSLYCRYFEADVEGLLPQIQTWIASEELWTRRVGLVSTIRYSGKNAVFLDPDLGFSLIEPVLADHRFYMQKATGWVLREWRKVHPAETDEFLKEHIQTIGKAALSRSVEHLPKEQIADWRDLKARAST